MIRATTYLIAAALGAALPAQFLPYGDGCGTGPAPRLLPDPLSRLDAGLPYTLECHHVPPGGFGFLALGLQQLTPPLSLASLGHPNCFLHVQPVVTLFMAGTGGVVRATTTMPNTICGVTLHAQALLIDPSASGPGLELSNPAKLVIDDATDLYTHYAFASNITANWTALDHPSLNGEPDAVFLVRDGSTADGIGVWYNDGIGRWTVFQQDASAMTAGRAFSVLLPNSRALVLRWRTTVGNTQGNLTHIDHPGLNGNPSALLHVTKLYESGSGLAGYHTNPIGVWYDTSAQKWTIFNQDQAAMTPSKAFQIVVADSDLESVRDSFVHTHTGSASPVSYINRPSLNNDENARLLVTQRWGSSGVLGAYNPAQVGFVYNALVFFQWGLQNLDSSVIPTGAAFNVLVLEPQPRGRIWTHTNTAANTIGHRTYVLDPAGPSQHFFATNNWNPPGSTGIYNDHEFRISHESFWNVSRYTLTNVDGGALPIGAAFNIVQPNSEAEVFSVVATSANTSGAEITLSNPRMDGDPNAIAFLQQVGSSANASPVGLRYSHSQQSWVIRNLDGAPMPMGAHYHCLVAGPELAPRFIPFEHTVTATNLGIAGHVTYLSHPRLDGQPAARVLVTQKGDVANPHSIGVYYSTITNCWAVFNQDRQAMPLGAEFHVLVAVDCP